MNNNIETIVIGDEWDDDLKTALNQILNRHGAKFISNTWGLAGSQEIKEMIFTLDGYNLKLVSETYIGLSLTGPFHLIDLISKEVKELLER